MTLDDIRSNLADQDRGRWLDVLDPWEGQLVLRLRIAGPDSDVQHRARIQMMDELAAAADGEGKVSFEVREKARVNCLGRCVLGWEIEEDGKQLPFSQKALLVFLNVAWIQQQADAFAADRANFRSEVA